ncbi:MAG: hypothetical protein QNJ56_12460 [Gammaproteobacteria bacterium]|nr:hypothetical protein [Gammaproteobacteria bacterium]
MKTLVRLPIIVLLSLLLVACGSGDSSDSINGAVPYDENTTQAKIDSGNAKDLAVAATAGTSASIVNEAKPKPSFLNDFLMEHSGRWLKSVSTASRAVEETHQDVCNQGSSSISYNSDFTQFSIVYENCGIAYTGFGQVVIDGTVESAYFSDGTSIVRYIDFIITYDGESYQLNQTLECNAEYTCYLYSDYAGPDGRIYRVEDATVSAAGDDRYAVTGIVFDPDYGSISIDADVSFGGCAGGVPLSGAISFTGFSDSTARVTFNDCNSFSVDFDGSSVSHIWAEILI